MKKNDYKVIKRLDYKQPDFTALEIELTFKLADEFTEVTSVTHYKRLTTDRKAPLVLDGEDLELKSVSLNGINYPYTIADNKLVIDGVPDDFELSVHTVIAPALNSSLMGLYKSSGVFCTQCEPMGFRRITYFLDRPDVLAKYKVTIIAPEYGCGVLLSNGNLIKKGVIDGRDYCVWEDPFPKPSYLFALVAGSFDIIEDTFKTKSGKNVKLELYVDRGAYNRGLFAMECIKQSMKWDEDRFNLEYDLDNFKVVAVDFFNQGAMENKSLNIFNSIYVLVDPNTATDTNYFNVQSVIGHEYFHNWTGDRVTLRDWFQLSLKESLTVFRDQEFSSDVASRALTRLHAIEVIRGAQFAEDASPMAHPVRPEQVMEMNNFYTVTIYDKGAEVIRMIHTILGEDKFQKGLAYYIEKFDGKAATVEDFVMSMEIAAQQDLSQFRRWYFQSGTPIVNCKWDYDASLQKLTISATQHTPANKDQKVKEPFVIPIRTSFLDKQGKKVVLANLQNELLMLTENKQEFVFENVEQELLPVLLRDFSAPVKLEAMYTQADYKHMLMYCDDPFIKQDSAISLINKYAHEHIDKALVGQLPEPSDIIEAFSMVLDDKNIDPLLVCEIVKIPSLLSMMEMFNQVDFDALLKLRKHLEVCVANALYDRFIKLYSSTELTGTYQYNIKDMCIRSLHNLAQRMLVIYYINNNMQDQANSLCDSAYKNAGNMTLKLSALTNAVHFNLACSKVLLDLFEAEYGDDPLVFDNYFRVQATAPLDDTVFNVRKLLRHDRYDKTNPNRVRALVGAMALSNPVALHKKDGTGYLLLCDVIRELDKINEHVAARIISPMLSFRRLDDDRAKLVVEQLEQLLSQADLSRSVYEKVAAALAKHED